MMASDAMPVRLIDLAPAVADFRSEVLVGLSRPQKSLSPKFFYDGEGCRLFEAICDLPEYYLTRTEMHILTRHAGDIATALGAPVTLIELGSGSSRKVRLLLDAVRPRRYVPLDIARDHLFASASAIARDYPWLDVRPICVDYSHPFEFPDIADDSRRIAFFPGSSIGNFAPDEAVALLRSVASLLGRDGGLLIGYDLKKDPAVLHRAYNDAAGLTAAFNLNLLRRINRELEGDFELGRFDHSAHFASDDGRVEMHLVSRVDQVVGVSGQLFKFAAGESIHTENSYKYGMDQFVGLAANAGFRPLQTWTDAGRLFCVQLFGLDDSRAGLFADAT
ncbi:L-histidine N(alpha)-methyltransferase [Methylotetracoccus oryzae]|uniref:L-histidine N(alpha)-methyltransferase n=1 Tax=Methylotetracoccus oryzae TaxID=1919059 RepID=UPI00111B3586|nr:L-histidine N(alpha)-methyltransferase [Methylotetracoccus oryzae]